MTTRGTACRWYSGGLGGGTVRADGGEHPPASAGWAELIAGARVDRYGLGHFRSSARDHRTAWRHEHPNTGAIWRPGVAISAAGWALTIGVIVVLLAFDLLLATVRPHAVGYREAIAWSAFYIAVAVAFGLVFASLVGWRYGAQYFAGYLVEKSLSVDNLFVFVIIMATFAVPREHQQRVLTFGIIAALVLRAVFIALGAALLSLLSFMFLLFGLLLLWTAVRLFRHREQDPDIRNNPLVRLSRRVLPVSETYAGGRLISRAGGRRVVTPLFIVFIAIGGTDILFALDSIPAVFGVTDQPYIVFVANAFALLGLRALYFLVTGLLDRLVYLSAGLALILAFIGVKLILHWAHGLDHRVPEISTGVSLAVIAAVLAVTTVASLLKSRRDPTARAHAGAVIGGSRRDDSGAGPSADGRRRRPRRSLPPARSRSRRP
jgi:tellurite resistance protein TerC